MARYIEEIGRHPNVFLSHSSADKTFVRKLANDLNVCEIDVWLDEWEIQPGDSIFQAINEGIGSSKYVALIISKSFLESKWSTEEVESAFSKQIEQNNKVILPILLEKVEIPYLLKGKLYISFIENYYHSLTALAGLLHGIDSKTISSAIIKKNPQCLEETLDALIYCGLDPYMIIPRDVFDELAKSGCVFVHGDRLSFSNGIFAMLQEPLSERTKDYLRRREINKHKNIAKRFK